MRRASQGQTAPTRRTHAPHQRPVDIIAYVDHVSGFGMPLGPEIIESVAGAGNRIMFRPPLMSTEEDIDRMVDILCQDSRKGLGESFSAPGRADSLGHQQHRFDRPALV